LDHTLQTRFPVPKITYFGTLGWRSALKNTSISRSAHSKRARIRASWAKFQNSPRRQPPAGCQKSVPRLLSPTNGHQRTHGQASPVRRPNLAFAACDRLKCQRAETALGASWQALVIEQLSPSACQLAPRVHLYHSAGSCLAPIFGHWFPRGPSDRARDDAARAATVRATSELARRAVCDF